jgi:outer membrane receptor protein involved in Fe transport
MAGLDAQYMDERITPFGNTLHGDAVVNFILTTRRLENRLDVTVGIYNLFDQIALSSPSDEHLDGTGVQLTGIPQEGRSLRLKAVYRF